MCKVAISESAYIPTIRLEDSGTTVDKALREYYSLWYPRRDVPAPRNLVYQLGSAWVLAGRALLGRLKTPLWICGKRHLPPPLHKPFNLHSPAQRADSALRTSAR
jgi:hypothetical protein